MTEGVKVLCTLIRSALGDAHSLALQLSDLSPLGGGSVCGCMN